MPMGPPGKSAGNTAAPQPGPAFDTVARAASRAVTFERWGSKKLVQPGSRSN